MLATLAALTLTLMPVSSQQTTLAWKGLSTTSGNPVVLAASPVESLYADVPCQSAVDLVGPDRRLQRILGTASNAVHPGVLSLHTDGSQVLWGTTQSDVRIAIPTPLPPDCRIAASYSGDDNTLSVSISGQSQSLPNAFPLAAGVDATTGPVLTSLWTADDVRPTAVVKATLHPSTVDWPAWRWLIVAVALTSLALAFRATAAAGTWQRLLRLIRGMRPRFLDFLLLGILLVSWVSTPPFYDDGWVLVTNREFPNVGFFSNYYSVGAAPQLQGFWWSFIERLWLFQGSPMLIIRLPAVLLTWVSWLFVRRYVVERLSTPDARAGAIAVAVSIVAVFGFAWLPTLRPEVMVSTLLAASFGLVLATRTWTVARLALVFTLAALGLALHQTGFMLLAPVAFASVTHVRASVRRSHAWLDLVWVSIFGGSLLAVAVMLHGSVATLRWSATAFSSESGHNQFLNEMERLALLTSSSALGGVWTAAILVLAGIAFALRTDRVAQPARLAGYLAAASAAMLLLTSSKWEGHLGATWLPSVVLVAAAVSSSWTSITARAGSLRSIVVAAAIIAVAMTIVGQGFVWTFSPWQAGTPGSGVRILSLMGLTGLLILPAWLLRERLSYPVLIPAIAGNVVVFMLLAAASFVTVDPSTYATRSKDSGAFTFSDGFAASTSPRYSWPGVLTSSCGAGDSMEIAANPVALVPNWELTGLSATTKAGLPGRQVTDAQPVPGTAVFEPVAPGRAVTPWFTLGPVKAIQWWVKATRVDTSQQVEFIDSTGELVEDSVLERRGYASTWQLYRVDVPLGAAFVRISYLPADAGAASTTGPVDATVTTSASTVIAEPVWRNPDEVFLMPCAPMPSIARGSFENFQWSIGTPRITPSGAPMTPLQAEASMVEQACITSNFGHTSCLYRITYPLAKTLTQTQTVVVLR